MEKVGLRLIAVFWLVSFCSEVSENSRGLRGQRQTNKRKIMKMKNKLIIAAVAGMFTVVSAKAQDATGTTTLPRDTTVIEVPPGRTVVEVAPGTTTTTVEAPAATVIQSPSDTTIVSEPAGATHVHTDDSPGWNMRDRFSYDRDDDEGLYPDQEMTFDLFGAFGDNKEKFNDAFDTTQRDGTWGAGIGMNYFFARCFGVGVDAFGLDNGADFVDAANLSVILRLPIDLLHLAPYVFGGGGRQFQGPDSWTAHVGTGLEIRLNRHTGIFLDGRYVFPKRGSVSEYTLLRSGVRFAF